MYREPTEGEKTSRGKKRAEDEKESSESGGLVHLESPDVVNIVKHQKGREI